MSEIRLNIGSGKHAIDGFIPIDIANGDDARRLRYEDGSVDEVRASHILEHFPYRQVPDVLKEWTRVLKPGGRMRIAVPNLRWIAQKYIDGEKENFIGYLMGGQADRHDYHHCVFDEPMLRMMMHDAGLVDIDTWTSDNGDCASLPVSLNLQGIRADATAPIVQTPDRLISNVRAVISMPRLAFSENMFCAMQSIAPLGIPLRKSSGVFWGQCHEALWEQSIADGNCDFILTVDYDTVFTAQDVVDMFNIISQNDQIDALCAVQMRREAKSALFTITDNTGKCVSEIKRSELARPFMPLNTGHFGLTFIRTSVLDRIERPWFLHKPSPANRWDEERMDEDVHFWHKFKKAGCGLFQANRIVLGHIEMMINWPTSELTPTYQNITDYEKNGKPTKGLIGCE